MGHVLRILALLKLVWKYGRLAHRLLGLYKAIESDYKVYVSRYNREYTQRFKQQVWERRLRRVVEIYHNDRYPLSPIHIIEMRERTWRAMNAKKPDRVEGKTDIKLEDVL